MPDITATDADDVHDRTPQVNKEVLTRSQALESTWQTSAQTCTTALMDDLLGETTGGIGVEEKRNSQIMVCSDLGIGK